MKQKPEMSFDRKKRQFQQDNKPVSYGQARERWDAIDSDWTIGAFNEMRDRIDYERKAMASVAGDFNAYDRMTR